METYFLFVGVATFIAVVGLVLLADRWRRAGKDQFAKTSHVLSEVLSILQKTQVTHTEQLGELTRSILQCHSESTKNALQHHSELKSTLADFQKTMAEWDRIAGASAKGRNELLREEIKSSTERLSAALQSSS